MLAGPALVLGLLLVLVALIGDRVTERALARGPVVRFLFSPLDPAAWRAAWAILGGAIVGVVGFSVVTSLFSAGASMLVAGIGIVVIALGIEAARIVARVERRRLVGVDPRPLHPHPYRAAGPGLRERAEGVFLDISRWRDVVYVYVAFPLAMLEATVVLVLLVLSIGGLSSPLWIADVGLGNVTAELVAASPAVEALGFAAGLALLPTAAGASRGLIALHRFVVANLLCVSEQAALVQRVETLETSRKAVLDVEASELRRIERDLHDGAQQRLVSLSMDLSLAAERLETDPAAARVLVLEAQAQARTALAELRDLVRGVAPSILMDRGLVSAVEALAARTPVPVTVVSSLSPGLRLPDAVERAAYFVVAEALTNVAKHGAPAGATKCEIRIDASVAALVIEVRDDGPGGAARTAGGGLAGLASRVEALDGHLDVLSPTGGGTTLRATIPLDR